MQLIIVYYGIIALILGLFLLLRGWFGKNIQTTPKCRKCNYDLRATWPDKSTCPECGTNLNTKSAVITKKHKKSPTLLALGLLLCLTFAWWEWQCLNQWAQSASFAPIQSISSLIRDTQSPDYQIASNALNELAKRISTGQLTKEEITPLVTKALKLQSNTASNWQPQWGNIIEAAWNRKLLTDQHVKSYTKNISPFNIAPFNPSPYAGQLATAVLQGPSPRLADPSQFTLKINLNEIIMDGKILPLANQSTTTSPLTSKPFKIKTGRFPVPMETGSHQIQYHFTIQLINDKIPSRQMPPISITRKQTIQVTPAPKDAVQYTCDELIRTEILKAITATITGITHFPKTDSNPEGPIIFGSICIDNPPIPIVTIAILDPRDGRPLPPWGPDISISPGGMGCNTFTSILPDFTGSELTILFTPNPRVEVYLPSLKTKQIWYGTMELNHVPVKWYDSVNDPDFPFKQFADRILKYQE